MSISSNGMPAIPGSLAQPVILSLPLPAETPPHRHPPTAVTDQYWSQALANQPVVCVVTPQRHVLTADLLHVGKMLLPNAVYKDHSFGAQFIKSCERIQTEQTIAGSGGGFLVDSWRYHRPSSGSTSPYTYRTIPALRKCRMRSV